MSLDENEEKQEINFDPLEIAACQWMSLDEWASSPEKHPVPITLDFARIAVDVLDGRDQLLEPYLIKIKSQCLNIPPWEVMLYRKKHGDEK